MEGSLKVVVGYGIFEHMFSVNQRGSLNDGMVIESQKIIYMKLI